MPIYIQCYHIFNNNNIIIIFKIITFTFPTNILIFINSFNIIMFCIFIIMVNCSIIISSTLSSLSFSSTSFLLSTSVASVSTSAPCHHHHHHYHHNITVIMTASSYFNPYHAKYQNKLVDLPFFDLAIINFGDIKLGIWSRSPNRIESGKAASRYSLAWLCTRGIG